MTEHSAEKDALRFRETIRDAVTETLGRFTTIGIGPERTAFREALVDTIARRVTPPGESHAAE